MACFHAIMEKNGEENDIRGKVLLKIPKSYSLGVAVSHSPNCCYIRLDDGDKLQESLKAMEQCMETQWIFMCVLAFLIYRIYLHTPLVLPEPLCRTNTWSPVVLSPLVAVSIVGYLLRCQGPVVWVGKWEHGIRNRIVCRAEQSDSWTSWASAISWKSENHWKHWRNRGWSLFLFLALYDCLKSRVFKCQGFM